MFLPQNIGISPVCTAIDMSIEFVNNWKKCCEWFLFGDCPIRIIIDYGTVRTNSDGGLWVGIPLNIAAKVKICDNSITDNNRVIITEHVYNEIPEDSIYRILFSELKTRFSFTKKSELKIYGVKYHSGSFNRQLRSVYKTNSTGGMRFGSWEKSRSALMCALFLA